MSPTLNAEQASAVACRDPRILCLAAPGAGKTRTLVERIASLVEDDAFSPSEILAITFTRKAAGEMRERLVERLGKRRAHGVDLSTFHSWACSTLRAYADKLGLRRDFTVRDDDDRADLILFVGKELALPWKSSRRLWQEEPVRVRYLQLLREANAVDFDGLEHWFRALLTKPEVVADLRARFRHVLVDEGQDTSAVQIGFLDALDPANLFVVGDHAQSIYGFRGADVDGFVALGRRLGWTTIKLSTNYRSLSPIVEAATRLGACMAEPGLAQRFFRLYMKGTISLDTGATNRITTVTDAPEILDTFEAPFVEAFNGYDCEAVEREIVEDVLEVVTEGHTRPSEDGSDLPWSECAILAPQWLYLEQISELLDRYGIPNVVARRRGEIWTSEEARTVVSAMRAALNPRDHLSLREALGSRITSRAWAQARAASLRSGRPISEALLGGCRLLAAVDAARTIFLDPERDSLFGVDLIADVLREDLHEQALDTRAARAVEVFNVIEAWSRDEPDGFDPTSFLDWYANRSLLDDEPEEKPEAVTLLTIHGAKGLEWSNVWVLGCDEGTLPRGKTPRAVEESRRLLYVALTRGRDRVRLCSRGKPSRFVHETMTAGRPPEWSQPRACVQCGEDVEERRRCYVSPTCYACLPPPEPLAVAKIEGGRHE